MPEAGGGEVRLVKLNVDEMPFAGQPVALSRRVPVAVTELSAQVLAGAEAVGAS
jgi:hypothetical protein